MVITLSTSGPSVTEWISTAAACFGAVGTVSAFGTGVVLLRREIQRDRRRQAELVNGYLMWPQGKRSDPTADLPSSQTETTEHQPSYCIVNGSDQPVYGVKLHRYGNKSMQYSVIPPGESRTEILNPAELMAVQLLPVRAIPAPFEFTDAGGIRWARKSDGRLSEVKKS